jgi:hypothetical protein
MSRLNDVGGVAGFGPIVIESDEPQFHYEWEARVFALNRVLRLRGITNLDEFRHAVERLDARDFYGMSYYERWFAAVELLLREKGIIT